MLQGGLQPVILLDYTGASASRGGIFTFDTVGMVRDCGSRSLASWQPSMRPAIYGGSVLRGSFRGMQNVVRPSVAATTMGRTSSR